MFLSSVGPPEPAIDVLSRSLAIYKTLNNSAGQAVVLLGLGGIYFKQRQFDKARDLIEEARIQNEKQPFESIDLQILNSLGDVYIELRDRAKATDALWSAYQLAKDRTPPQAIAALVNYARTNGVEIEGFGSIAQKEGAKSVLATLWSVADVSTKDFMVEFYRLYGKEGVSKANAMRRAQLKLMYGKYSADEVQKHRADDFVQTVDKTMPAFKTDANAPFAHPYYWSPFTLIGNWR